MDTTSSLQGTDHFRDTEERWLEQARFEGPFGEKEASEKLLEQYAFSEGWQVHDLDTYGLLFVLPLVGEPAKSYLVVAEHNLGNIYQTVGWMCSRMGWSMEKMMIGRCVPTKESLELKMERGGSSWADPDRALFERAVKAGVMIAKDPMVRFHGGSVAIGMGTGSMGGGNFGSTWEDKMVAENAKVIWQRKNELGIGN